MNHEGQRLPQGSRLLGSVLRCLALIDDFAAAPGALSIGDLAELTGEKKSTIHQRVQTLVAAGWVEQMPDSRYRLTVRSVIIGAAVLEQADLGSRVLPALQELAGETQETSTLNVLHGPDAIVIQEARTDQLVRVDVHVGTHLPLDISASGRALASLASREEVDQAIAAGAKMPSDEILETVRAQGFATQQDEFLPQMSSIAIVVPTPLKSVAVTVTAPTHRFEAERYLEALEHARARISRLFSA
jgi:IclR family acetate operon transcriptional repressor